MRERPIIFSGPMVKAIMEGRKTQTRRVVAPQPRILTDSPYYTFDGKIIPVWQWGKRQFWPPGIGSATQAGLHAHAWCAEEHLKLCPYGQPGDLLWVREGYCHEYEETETTGGYLYRADWPEGDIVNADDPSRSPWRSPLFMPRKASRLILEVASVKVERLQDISEEDARAEGMERLKSGRGWYNPTVSKGAVHMGNYCASAREAFTLAWEQINGGRPRRCWDDNPWVWCIEFRKSEKA